MSSAPSTRCAACASASSRPAFQASDWYLGRVAGPFRYRRCDRCGTVFMHPQIDDEMLKRAYAETYGPHRSAPTVVERIGERLAQREADRLVAVADADSTLIDLGAGRGAFLGRIQRAGWRGPIRGVEPDGRTARAASAELGISIEVATVEEVELEHEAAGVVVMRHVIEHVRGPAPVLSRVASALAPGGILYLATPDARALAARVFGCFWHGYDPPRHLYAFTRDGVRTLLGRTGFELVDERWDFAPQMWTGSLRHALGEFAPRLQALGNDLNPFVAIPAAAAAALEVVLHRSTMYAVTARRVAS
jgi:SAM-dependent methyltransferase